MESWPSYKSGDSVKLSSDSSTRFKILLNNKTPYSNFQIRVVCPFRMGHLIIQLHLTYFNYVGSPNLSILHQVLSFNLSFPFESSLGLATFLFRSYTLVCGENMSFLRSQLSRRLVHTTIVNLLVFFALPTPQPVPSFPPATPKFLSEQSDSQEKDKSLKKTRHRNS